MKVAGDEGKVVAKGTLVISDAEADRYCVPNGHYEVMLDETVLYQSTGLHAFVTFSSPAAPVSVSLTGFTNTLNGSFAVGVDAKSWYPSITYRAPISTDTSTPSSYGASVAQFGSLVAIGAPDCTEPCTQGGTVGLYEVYSNDVIRTFYSPNSYSGEKFGFSVAINRDYLAVGAIGSAVQGADSGRVYVYSTHTFEVDAELTPDANSAGARFGYSLSIFQGEDAFNTPESDLPEWLSIGAPGGNEVYVYLKSSTAGTWGLSSKFSSPEEGATEFGRSVSWHTDDLVVSGLDESNTGFVSLYENMEGKLEFQVTLVASDSSAGNDFGFSISMYHVNAYGAYGYVLGVGAPGVNHAYVFVRNPTTNQWTQNSMLVAPEPNAPEQSEVVFGSSVSVYERFIAVGGPGVADNSGYVLMYTAMNKTADIPVVHWSQQAVLIPAATTNGEKFGSSVSLYGPTVIAGSPGRPETKNGITTTGAAPMFMYAVSAAPSVAPTAQPDQWFETEMYVAPVNSKSNTPSAFGSSVDQFGSLVAIGAPECNSPCTSGGAVSLYEVYSPELLKTVCRAVYDLHCTILW
jgi:hypothetical protein